MSATLALLQQLVARPSVTPADAGCQELIRDYLAPFGFSAEPLPFDEVANLWLRRGNTAPLLVFAGHTDVVPPGPREHWQSDPFTPTAHDGYLYGRGTADMKGGLAAMVTACAAFVQAHPEHAGSLGLLLTSDEEGPAVNGTRRVVDILHERNEAIDWCIVGEPSSQTQIADTLKNGRRGSLNGHLVVHGRQGHIAYPQFADNPVHRLAPALAELAATQWDQGNAYFPPTQFQVSNIHAGTGAENVIPGAVSVDFNFRFAPCSTAEDLQTRLRTILDRHDLNYSLDFRLSGQPFQTETGAFTTAISDAVETVTGYRPICSTAGGTSDGRFIAAYGIPVVELGPVNQSIHQVNEHVRIADLDPLQAIYIELMRRLLLR